ncbi:hypothetical protein EXIGLDRAFT_832455 [Exidia glandulosa HHB12029]|uniref:F-box domain-containing protein n=1 Tax=Exidia glandulosa HHB12029 TaxID=1314781 RepID=A0A165LLB5_EXIGL|nr:hypothetical protein EXIGLDRAFT_832455 [Exidia glandulosa HHB12029]
MPTLPYDVLRPIITRERLSRSALCSLCLVSREFYGLANPRLFHTVAFSSIQLHQLHLFLQAITVDLILARNVVSLSIDTKLVTHATMRIFIDALPGLQMLHHLYCRSVAQCIQYDVRTIDYIAALPRLESFHILIPGYSTSAEERLLDRLSAMKHIRIDNSGSNVYRAGSSSLGRLLSRSKDTLEKLELVETDQSISVLADPHYPWSQVEELTVSMITSRSSARSFPNVRRLSVLSRKNAAIDVDALVDPTFFPHLTQLAVCTTGSVEGISVKRDIRHLFVELTAPSFFPFLTLFNWGAFRSLHLSWTRREPSGVLDTLHTVLEQCNHLRYLGFHSSESLHPDADVLPFLEVLNIPSGRYPASLRYIVLTVGHDKRQSQGQGRQSQGDFQTTRAERGVARGITRLFSSYPRLCHFQTTRGIRSEIWRKSGLDSPIGYVGALGGDRVGGKVFFKFVDEEDALTTNLDDVARFIDLEESMESSV